MSDAPASPGGGSHESGEHSPRSNIREQDRFLPIANISRIMKKALPANGKIAKDAKETVQECVSEFISFITSEASDKCQREKRKTINGDDLLWAMATLGFEDYIDPLKIYLTRYRENYFEVLLLLCFLLMVVFFRCLSWVDWKCCRWRVILRALARVEIRLLRKIFNKVLILSLFIKVLSHKVFLTQILRVNI
ncbi:nuclear transcription factor Y subunit B-like isoform X1 [Vicia villosa]|uniref:nuclear transcription factor Y subunit B-like isoform X1 n=1 Tax=Vicia villosa TaxID=3911 RepID=UPI00273AA1A6|nr:nuclear transcription factor Y subunit B-like isoform X1 [Vicia villosa]